MKKVLMVSIVPPFPDDQGNRVATRNIMNCILELGYNIDLVLQAGYDRKGLQAAYGNRVKVIETKSADSFDERNNKEKKRHIKELLKEFSESEFDAIIKDEIFDACNHFHPFSFISCDTVEKCETLLKENEYGFIVCNYIYTLRVIRDLEKKFNLPKVFVITYDAVSRLDFQAREFGIDTAYRACSARMEADCLNYSDVVCCITDFEKRYFERIGVKRKRVLMEYDAEESIGEEGLEEDVYEKRKIIFIGSNNPLNQLGIKGFLEKCWGKISEEVPGTKLSIIGNVCNSLDEYRRADVILRGRLSEDDVKEEMRSAFASINPVYLGTGLKIKSVDALCFGLPLVSTPCGIEGLESFINKGCLLANNWDEFSDQLLRLYNNKGLWEKLRKGALEGSKARFSKEAVYSEFLQAVSEGGAHELSDVEKSNTGFLSCNQTEVGMKTKKMQRGEMSRRFHFFKKRKE